MDPNPGTQPPTHLRISFLIILNNHNLLLLPNLCSEQGRSLMTSLPDKECASLPCPHQHHLPHHNPLHPNPSRLPSKEAIVNL